MSYRATDNLVKRIIKAQNELKTLKATQFIGGDNMGYYEYILPGFDYTLGGRSYWGLFITFLSETAFPLCSVECEVYENNSRILNPRSTSPVPYNSGSSSTCVYSFLEGSSYPAVLGAPPDFEITYDGMKIRPSDPKCFMSVIIFQNSTNNNVNVKFRNIKLRTTHPGVMFGFLRDPYGGF